MVTSNFGFSITSPLKAIARGAKGLVTDPNVRSAAVAATQEYAPGQYARIAQEAARVRRVLPHPPRGRPPMAMMPPPDGDDGGGDADAGPPPIKASHGLITVAALVGAALLILMVAKK